jgi:cellobiose phosphorylase
MCGSEHTPASNEPKLGRTAEEFRMHPFQFLRAALSRIDPFQARNPPPPSGAAEAPLRAELFGVEQMERSGKTLSAHHAVRGGRGGDQLLRRLEDNEGVLQSASVLLVAAVRQGRRVTPAGEWLLDNFYLVEEQILLARSHFSKWYSRELPVLSSGPSKGLARVYDIALEVISHGDGRIDPETLNRFVAAYQTGAQLKLGELWAIPIMMRLALIENLRRISARVAASMVERNRASVWADQMLSVAEHDPKSLILVISDMARASPDLVNSFVAELARRLQGHSSALALPLTWIEQRLRESSMTIEQMVQSETQSQAINQVCISNSIASLRLLSAMDWREFVESQSQVERELREDPEGVYARMDFSTRDRYRHVVERIARQSPMTEPAVARKAVQLAHHACTTRANNAPATPTAPSRAAGLAAPAAPLEHVGYYLVGDGLAVLERAAQVQRSFGEDVRLAVRHAALPMYLGSITLLSLLWSAGLLWWASVQGMPLWALLLAGPAALLVTSQCAVTLVNWFATLLVTPHALPRMDFSKGITAEARTLVVVPTMLNTSAGVHALVEALEVRFLSNQDVHLHYGLLTDWGDAATQTVESDAALLQVASDGIRDLNTRYPGAQADTFFLFHRARLWNAREALWMGFERKRGKLAALNALLRGSDGSDFALIVGNVAPLQAVQYVITLDTDTQLQRDSARSFAATMAHPLNRPHFNASTQCVTSGYGILQPRMAVSLQSSNGSRYARLMGSEAGVDPYTRAVSDVYQDLFLEGSFIGKGIYDVDAFEQALKDRFPDNRILSHDLLEGCYARTGLISDVQLYDDYPARYDTDVKRRTRWMRGDWQIASWLLPYVPGNAMGKTPPAGQTQASAIRRKNHLSYLSQWKILDNLRRSLVAPGMVALLLLGWMQMQHSLAWTLALLGTLVCVPVVSNLYGLLRKPRELPWGQHARAVLGHAQKQLLQAVLTLALFPHEAWYSAVAIMRTSVRVLLTGHRLLEWQASDAPLLSPGQRIAPAPPGGLVDLQRTYLSMVVSPLLALGVAWLLTQSAVQGGHPVAVVPILLLWLLAPAWAWWLSRPTHERAVHLGASQIVFLRKLTRKTWRFFEECVTAQDLWLPPDNYQEHPVAVLAHRTSPTNMGMALLANVAACDFGYISAATLIQRSADALQSMQRLERYNGHFFNWYDTQNGAPLRPRYVSAVDSGNLSGHLLTLRPALLELLEQPVVNTRTFEGLQDALASLHDALDTHTGVALSQAIAQLRRGLDVACEAPALNLRDTALRLTHTDEWVTAVLALCTDADATQAASERLVWARAMQVQCRDALADLQLLFPLVADDAFSVSEPVPTLRALAASGNAQAQARMQTIAALAMQAAAMARADYSFLYDATRHLIAVGYNVDDQRRDSGYYDLLASEARLCSFVAIAQGEVPQENWFALGRLLTSAGDAPTLLSWSGSMFEYLMPNLVMPVFANTLLAQTSRAVVQRQMAYGEQQSVPWGISESGYNAVDAALNYQYHAFGVPGLGLKRGLSEDLVVAPYASALALMVMPEQACKNLLRLVDTGLLGAYGMYEAIDYTPARIPRGQSGAIVRSFMAHHQGMTLLALAHVLLAQPMQKRFCSDPLFQATMLLLQERIPSTAVFHAQSTADISDIQTSSMGQAPPMRILRNPDAATPEVQLLSNGRYHVMVSQSGAGYSRWKDMAVTRWHEDATRDNWGTFCYLRDVESGAYWSSAHQPVLRHSDSFEAIFSEGRVEFRRRDNDFESYTEIVVSPEDDIELRRTRITNRSRSRRTIEVTSYAEVVLAPAAADTLHPAFSNLFVQTEIVRERQAIVCHRRPRSDTEASLWLFHLMAVHGADAQTISYETDRMAFVGRTRSLLAPQAMIERAFLSDSQGAVLDPIVAIRQRITLEPQQTVTVDMVTGVADTRTVALALVDKYRDMHLADRVFELAMTHAWVNLQQINASEGDAQVFARLASSVIYANPAQRAPAQVLARNRRGQSGLWGYGVSGDLPMVLLQISSLDNIDLVRQLVQAHAYWRLKGLAVDLVIWNEDHAGYRQALQDQIHGLIAAGIEANLTDRPGGIFVRAAEQMSPEDRTLFQTVARIIITDTQGSLKDQANRHQARDAREMPPQLVLAPRPPAQRLHEPALPQHQLQFFNGLGGFSADGREYVITTRVASGDVPAVTPLPWVNVIANARFGTVVSESGSAYTWSENAHEYRYTPWSNDPVGDGCGEAIYIRDEETGAFWSPTALPCGGAGDYVTRHGFGYSSFAHVQDGIASELTVFVDLEAAIKFSRVTLRNLSPNTRSVSVTGYVEWVLGDLQAKSTLHVTTEIDPNSGAILARNPYSPEFGDRMAFFDADGATRAHGVTVSGDRREFLGRNGTLRNPAAMRRTGLSNRVGAGMDPCAAVQVPIELLPGQEREVIFRLGAAGRRGLDDARVMVQQLREPHALANALHAVHAYWARTLSAVQVHTPDAALNVLANGWLVYQTLACRLWARTGFYQSGGAFGFRDQLQDCMALVHSEPALLREHLLRCASRQFVEGDVQHWWHPPQGRGVRTHCSDDYLWLAQATCRYVLSSGDTGVLDESASFLQGRALNPEEDSYYDLPIVSEERATLYQHCVRAIRYGLRFGTHGLPLMGSGDWNDGMNLVGIQGRGESVWLAFFLYDTLQRFAPLARAYGDAAFADECLAAATVLKGNIAEHGWDGSWYRRAYFDDGTPLGSATNAECQIDSVTQSWAVLSGAGDTVRNQSAMEVVDQRLVHREAGLIQLLTPPFDTSVQHPGYIKGYVPGVRENGGQYTHAAIWTVMAFAAQQDHRRAWECFDLINPVRHGNSAASTAIYQVEPYVVAADVYAVLPHTGRGGWTWYTGSASWMYRLITESLLGLRLQAQMLHFAPCLPAAWPGFGLHYRFGDTTYAIEVVRVVGNGAIAVLQDGVLQDADFASLVDDQQSHTITVQVPAQEPNTA